MARPSLQNNVKFKALARRLNLPRPYVRGLLDTMWDVANESGNPVLGTPDDVESAAEWPGKPGDLFPALRDLRLVDPLEDGRWVIHDYWDHAPHYVKNRMKMEARRKGSFRPKSNWKVDSSISNDLRSDCVEQCNTVVQSCATPAPAPLKTPKGVLSAGADAAPHAPDPALPGSSRSRNAGRIKTAQTKKKQEDRPEHAEVREYFRSEWQARYAAPYAWNFGKEGAHLKRLLDLVKQNAPKAKAIIDRYLQDDDPWLTQRTHEFSLLASRVNRYRASQGQDQGEGDSFVRAEHTDAEWDSLLMEGRDAGNAG